MPSPETWTRVLEQVFRGFLGIKDVGPDWLVEPATGRGLVLHVLYPELGIAFWFRDSGGAARPGAPDYEAILVRQCRQAGITLVAPDSISEVDAGALGDVRAALSRTARRVAQQEGAGEVKRDLLPRIASAKEVCLQILEDRRVPPPEPQRPPRDGSGVRSQVWREFPRPSGEHVATLGALLSFLLSLLRRVALFVIVLLAVNAAAYLVANFLYLRGPMAYNYVPDSQVSLTDVFATYPEYLRNVLEGDFGMMRLQEFGATVGPITDLLGHSLPRSLILLGAALGFSVIAGMAAGFLSVNYKTYRTKPLALVVSIAGFSMPGFYMAILIIYLMIRAAMTYGREVFLLPTTGYGLDTHLILPVLALSVRPMAEIARLTAELLSEELPKDYIRVARSKGLSERVVIRGHAFRNVVAAVVNALSNSWAYLLGSLVIVETVFNWGGVGESLVKAVTFSQYAGSRFNPALVAGLATAMALLFLLADLVTGLTARALDPRLRRARTTGA